MALATTMTRRTSRPDPISNAYKVALCVRAQGGSPQTAHRSASASRDQIAEPTQPELNAEAEARRAVTGRSGSRFERCGAVRRQPG